MRFLNYFWVYLKLFFSMPYLIFKAIKDKRSKGFHLYGIYGYFGLAGRGKTISMVHQLEEYRKKYGDNIYIMTNFFYKDQDFPFTHWKDLLKSYDKPLVVAWDEIVNELNSRDWKNFPPDLFGLLTQVRKGNGIQILYTAQDWRFVDTSFRRHTFGAYDCKTYFGNLTSAAFYQALDYDHLMTLTDFEKRKKIYPVKVVSFFQTEKLRNCFDSYKMLEAAKSKEYLDREEMRKIYKLGD